MWGLGRPPEESSLDVLSDGASSEKDRYPGTTGQQHALAMAEATNLVPARLQQEQGSSGQVG